MPDPSKMWQGDDTQPTLNRMRGICQQCQRYHGGVSAHCEAFPNLIPTPIWLGEFDHHQPWAGDKHWPSDRGLQFVPKEDA